jgi:hypothetical protein
VGWGDFLKFLELFSMETCDVASGDVACFLNF